MNRTPRAVRPHRANPLLHQPAMMWRVLSSPTGGRYVVSTADTACLDLAPQCAGLLAISLGLSRLYPDDHEQLRHGFVVYDALYAWLRDARDEPHSWNPERNRAPA